MGKIQVLTQAVADKIAAGEVAERPSAVVKELVENAIDAGADKIQVEVRKGGVAYIRVTDNGSGIEPDQVETAFLRHATSKLHSVEELYHIATMGFRGEALASICAVAEVEVITKTPEKEEGIYLHMVHGVPEEKEPMACGDGTTMIVQNLFANVPARMKFLKKDSTEAGYIGDMLGRVALSKPHIAFSYTCDGKDIFATSGDGSLQNVILRLYGMDHAKALIPVDYTEEHVHITGVLGKPEISRGNRTRQTLFVNGRYIKNHVVSKVVEEAFRNAVMVGKFPFFVLDITLSPENVDVNVHPAKTEIKFANEKKIYDIVYHGVYNAIYGLGKYRAAEADEQETVSTQQDIRKGKVGHTAGSSAGGISVADTGAQRLNPAVVREFIKNTTPLINTENTGASLAKPKEEEELLKALDEHAAAAWQREAPSPMPSSNDEAEVGEAVPTGVMEFVQQADTLQHKEMPKFVLRERDEVEEGIQQSFASDRMDQEKTIVPEEGIRIAGQVFDTYILCESGENMYMIDQHAAHERLRFEELKRAYQKQERMSQLLLSPMVLSLDFAETQVVLEHLDVYKKFGFELEDFGAGSVIVHATPVAADQETIRDLILEIAEALRDYVKHPVADFEERALDMIACKYAIKANHRLTLPEMQDLALRIWGLEAKGITTCPHGRPIRISFTKTEIEKMFKRKL